MRPGAVALCLVLSACVETPSAPVAGVRDLSAPMAATTRFDPKRLAGDWVVRQTAIAPNVGSLSLAWDGAGYAVTDGAGRRDRYTLTQGARWRDEAGTETWVLWVDADYRTAALGNPDGTVGMIVDRAATGGADRITAAREIMDWFGYDLAGLK